MTATKDHDVETPVGPAEVGATTKSGKKVVFAPISAPQPPALNDKREDGAPILNHFVEVTSGDDKGFVGVFLELQGDTAVVRSKSDTGYRVSCPFSDLKAHEPYSR